MTARGPCRHDVTFDAWGDRHSHNIPHPGRYQLAAQIREQWDTSKLCNLYSCMGYFHKAIVQSVLLYGAESLTVTDGNINQLRNFYSWVARYICGRHIGLNADGTWNCPSTAEVLEEVREENRRRYLACTGMWICEGKINYELERTFGGIDSILTYRILK